MNSAIPEKVSEETPSALDSALSRAREGQAFVIIAEFESFAHVLSQLVLQMRVPPTPGSS